jgi:hypothetical protein
MSTYYEYIARRRNTIFVGEEESEECPKVFIFWKLWSDDFDPNKLIQSNRQSVWIKTTTLLTMSSLGENISVTYPLSFSLKGLDRDVVEESFLKEINVCVLEDHR